MRRDERDLRPDPRAGFGLLGLVLMVTLIVSVVVLAVHSLWRGSSRTLFGIQENRQMVALAHSSLAECQFSIQRALDQNHAAWTAWCTDPNAVEERAFAPAMTRERMRALQGGILYRIGDVSIVRTRPLLEASPGSGLALGVVDLQVSIDVQRDHPRHAAHLKMKERHHVRMADDLGPYRGGEQAAGALTVPGLHDHRGGIDGREGHSPSPSFETGGGHAG